MRSLRNRLALIFGLIVLGAIAVVYFGIVPQLEDRLRDQKLERLAERAEDASRLERVLGTNVPKPEVDARVGRLAAASATEVTVLGVARGTANALFVVSDSTPDGGIELEDVRDVAGTALATGRTATGTEPTRLGRRALAGRPVSEGQFVVVLSDDLADVQATVGLIRRRILVSGAIALIGAVVAGWLVANALAARVKRLERAARRVAAGDFAGRISVDREDELGQLAAAFADMQAQLARLDRARKHFIASASHELRTPIFSLGGFLELLEDEDLDEATRRRFIAQVRGQVERLRVLATELLDLSRLEAGALELHPEPTDVALLAREVAEEFAPALARESAALELRAPGPLEAEVDPDRVAQVLRILLDNAIVHTPAGTGIVVSARREDGHVRLEVADAGLGIKRQAMPHIFDPFFSDGDGARGAGLGLAIARELAGQMRGELAVRSAPGTTAFTLVLPG